LYAPTYKTLAFKGVTRLTAESARPTNPAVDEAAVVTGAQAPNEALLGSPGRSPRVDSTISKVEPKWFRKTIIHMTMEK